MIVADQMETKAIDIFRSLEVGILNVVKAADLFTVHLLSNYRKTETSHEIIQIVLNGSNVSGFTVWGGTYKSDEITMLEQTGHIRQIGEQIVLATYTALEIYLIQKFKEYYAHILRDRTSNFVQNTLRRFSFRGLDEIKKHYSDILSVHLPSFDIEYFSDEKSHFQSKDSWTAISLLSIARNEIAHSGASSSYKITSPMDSWFPFDFARRWVSLFDANFDFYFYQGTETSLYKEYKQRLQQSIKN